MARLDRRYPAYGFAAHKGYGTAGHQAALRLHGPCVEHRKSFEPIKASGGRAGVGGARAFWPRDGGADGCGRSEARATGGSAVRGVRGEKSERITRESQLVETRSVNLSEYSEFK